MNKYIIGRFLTILDFAIIFPLKKFFYFDILY